jgi:hypothetical protein
MIYDPIKVLVNHASEVTTEEGNTYYKIPYWFKVSSDGERMEILKKKPEDLINFIVKSGLGEPNPQIKRPKE